MTKLEEFKLRSYERRLGRMTSAQALNHALIAENVKRSMEPFDPARELFAQQQLDMEAYAELLEKAEVEARVALTTKEV